MFASTEVFYNLHQAVWMCRNVNTGSVKQSVIRVITTKMTEKMREKDKPPDLTIAIDGWIDRSILYYSQREMYTLCE